MANKMKVSKIKQNNNNTSEDTENNQNYNIMLSSLSNSLSDYIVQAPIGRGAGSFVVKVQSRKSKNEYAVKVIDKKCPQYVTASKRLKNEIEIHSALNHPNIVKLINSFEDSDNHYIMLEYCEGGDLFHYLKGKGKLCEQEIKAMSYQLAQGLFYLHENKILHRDLKLGNILLSDENTLKICDFGLAIKLNDFEQERNTLCGTPNYISPEIINREPYGMKIDCWSFGCILYALLTGHPPFESQSIQETLKKVKQKNNLDLPNDVSPELKDLLVNIINWNAEGRYTIQQILAHPFYHSIKLKQQLSDKKSNYEKQNYRYNNNKENDSYQHEEIKQEQNYFKKEPKLQKNNNDYDSSNNQSNLNQEINSLQKDKQQIQKKEKPSNILQENKSIANITTKDNILNNKHTYVKSMTQQNFYQNQNSNNNNKENEGMQKMMYKHQANQQQQQLFGKNKASQSEYYEQNSQNNKQNIDEIQQQQNKQQQQQQYFLKNSYIQDKNGQQKVIHHSSTHTHSEAQFKMHDINKLNKQNEINQKQILDNTNSSFFPSSMQIRTEPCENIEHYTPRLNELEFLNSDFQTADKNMMSTTQKSFMQTINPIKSITSFISDIEAPNSITPLKIGKLRANKFQTKNGFIEITQEGWLKVEACNGRVHFNISPKGSNVKIDKIIDNQVLSKSYNVQKLPQKYHSLYSYAKTVCHIVKSKTPKIKLETPEGKFVLMEDENFEAQYKNGFKAQTKLNSNIVTVQTQTKMNFTVNTETDLSKLNAQVVKIVNLTLKYLASMTQKDTN